MMLLMGGESHQSGAFYRISVLDTVSSLPSVFEAKVLKESCEGRTFVNTFTRDALLRSPSGGSSKAVGPSTLQLLVRPTANYFTEGIGVIFFVSFLLSIVGDKSEKKVELHQHQELNAKFFFIPAGGIGQERLLQNWQTIRPCTIKFDCPCFRVDDLRKFHGVDHQVVHELGLFRHF